MAVDDSSSSSSFRELDDVFLQSQARIWIGEVLHTRFDEQISICDLLSDGELLFEVSKTLWNMLLIKYMELKSYKARMFIPVDTRKSSGRYRPYSNVDSFLKVCKVMGLSGVDLFSPSDVVEKKNTRKVCVCIRSLSMKARSKQLNVPDFDIVTNTIAMPTDVVGCIRRSLESSSTPSVTCGESKHARLKPRKKTSSASHKQEDESYLEESDEAKSHFSDASNRELDKFAHTPRSVLLQYVNSSVLGRVLDFDFDFESDDLTNFESSTYEKITSSYNQDSFSPWWDDIKSVDQDLEYLNKIEKDLGHSLVLVKDDVTKSTHNADGIFNEDTSKASSKDERKHDGLAKADTNEKNEKRAEKKPSYIAPLLKTVAKGTALVGIMFLLQMRNRNTKTEISSQIHWNSKRKEEKGTKIYPVEKFKLQD